MKNSLKFAVLFLLSLAFASCKKDYTCVCTSSSGDSTTQTIEAISKSQASKVCDAFEFDFLGVTTSCSVN